jgi:hypothetical protein
MTPEPRWEDELMTTELEAVRAAALELGLEDWIPLPEAISSSEVQAALRGAREPWVVLAEALKSLLVERRIKVYRGRWDDLDAPVLSATEALEVLGDARWYSFHIHDPDEERVCFVNVENIRDQEA